MYDFAYFRNNLDAIAARSNGRLLLIRRRFVSSDARSARRRIGKRGAEGAEERGVHRDWQAEAGRAGYGG